MISQTGQLCRSSDRVLDQLLEEVTRRIQNGELIDVEAFVAAHPDYADRLRRLLPAMQALVAFGRSQSAAAHGPNALPGAPSSLEAGVLGDFRIVGELGRGGMGVVYEAEQISLGRRVALKVLPFAAVLDERQLARFKNEARAAAQLDHPNIVKVHSVGCERGVHYYAMQFIEGHTLAEVIAKLRAKSEAALLPLPPEASAAAGGARRPPASDSALLPLPLGEGRGEGAFSSVPRSTPQAPSRSSTETLRDGAATIISEHSTKSPAYYRTISELGIQAAEALEHAHEVGIIHRDIKPSNLMVDAGGRLWVTDFGLARIGADANLTMTGDMLGTLRYMSPEQAQGKATLVDHRADIYSLGVTLYELLTRQPAFPGDDRQELQRAIADREPPPPRQLDKSIPADLETIVGKAMAKDAADRYATAALLADDLHRFLEHKPIEARRPSLLKRVRKWSRRNRAIVATACAVAVCALLIGTGLLWRERSQTLAALEDANDQREFVQKERDRAEAALNKARQAVDEMYTGVAEEWLDQQPELTEVQRDFLEKALAFYEQFAAETGDHPQARFDVASARLRAGKIQRALGAFDQAEISLTKSVAQLEELLASAPEIRKICIEELGEAITALADLNSELGRTDETVRLLKQAVAIFEESVVRQPEDLELQGHLAAALRMLGANTFRRDSRLAEKYLIRGRDLSHELVAKGHKTAHYRLEAARGEKNLANLYIVGERLPEAEKAIQLAIDHFEELLAGDPADPDYRSLLGSAVSNQAVLLDRLGRKDEALEAFRRSAAIFEALAKDFPRRTNRSKLLADLFNLIQALKNPEEIAQVGRKGIELGEGLVHDFPAVPQYQEFLPVFHLAVGHSIRKTQPEQARSHWERAYALGEKLMADFPDEPKYSIIVAVTSSFSANNYAAGPPDDPLYNPALALKRARRAVELMPENVEYLAVLGVAQFRTGDFEECIATIERANANEKANFFDDFYLSMAHWRLGNKALAHEKFKRAEPSLDLEWDPLKYLDKPTAQRIRDEAAALLGLPPSSADQTAKPAPKP